MHIVHVHVQVKEEHIQGFIAATLENARSSLQEAGVARFDFVQSQDDPSRFVLVEAYRTPNDQLRHRETAHYLKWRDAVAEMMAAPRRPEKYTNLFPADADW